MIYSFKKTFFFFKMTNLKVLKFLNNKKEDLNNFLTYVKLIFISYKE